MPGKTFISYRRDDVAGDARGIRDGLAARFGRGSVFMDVDNLLPGQRFDRKLAEALSACDVLVAVIGPRWIELLEAREQRKAETGEPDYVRAEIAEALRRGIVVIPVRVGREGQMPPLPRRDDLPEDVRDLVLHHKHDVAHERFGRDLAGLAQAIVAVRRAARPPGPPVPWRWAAAGAAGLGVAVLLALYVTGTTGPRADKVEPAQQAAEAAKEKAAAEAARRDPALSVRPGSGESFRDRLADGRPCPACPELVVVPAGSFTMGSPPGEEGRFDSEDPQRRVAMARPIAVGRFEVMFAEWDACVDEGGCAHNPSDSGWGGGKRPVINVSWDDITKQYIPWLSRKTGKTYRLLTESEWEYAVRAGTTTPFWWGSSISISQANYNGVVYLRGRCQR